VPGRKGVYVKAAKLMNLAKFADTFFKLAFSCFYKIKDLNIGTNWCKISSFSAER
jgi:hypothetical protein